MNNDQEWRSFLLDEVREMRKDLADVKKEMTTLKVKVAFFSSIIGSVATFIANKMFHH